MEWVEVSDSVSDSVPISQFQTVYKNPERKELTGLRGVISSSGPSLCKVIPAQILSYSCPSQRICYQFCRPGLYGGGWHHGENIFQLGLGTGYLGS